MARGGDYAATPRSRQALLPPLHLHICRPASPALLQVEDALVYEQSTDEEGEEETDEQEEQEEEEAEEEEVAPPFAQLLGPYPVTFLQGRVASVQPEHATQVRAGRVDSRTAADSGAGSAGRLAGSSRG